MRAITNLRPLTALVAPMLLSAAAVFTAAPATAQGIPVDLSADELACQKATFDATVKYLENVFAARQDCFDRVVRQTLPDTVNCFGDVGAEGTGDDDTDQRLQNAIDRLSSLITAKCLGIDFAGLGFPGPCELEDGAPYTSLDHELCIKEQSDEVVMALLDVEHPPLPAPVPPGDHNCQDLVARKASTMFVKEFETRSKCLLGQYERTVSPAVDCRAEDDRMAPATGDKATDRNVVRAHDRVLQGIANGCLLADLEALGFPHRCPLPAGSTFTIAALVECMFESHHGELIRLVDTTSPVTSQCGNGDLDFAEECDDGDADYNPGDFCRANCTLVIGCGDTNDDGRITVQDAQFLLRVAVGLESCSLEICDVDGNGRITTTDVLLLLQRVVGNLDVALDCPAPAPNCGDGVRDAFENCDDGDRLWMLGESCNAACRLLQCGDPNDSGTITAQDSAFILRVTVGLATCDLEVCDVDGSGAIRTADVLAVLQIASGLADGPLNCPL